MKTNPNCFSIADVQLSYRYLTSVNERTTIKSASRAYDMIKEHYADFMELKEVFFVAFVNQANHLIALHKHSEGGIKSTVVDFKILFSLALNCLSQGIIVFHNHPSGNLRPSEQDKKLTKQLKEACALLDIQLIDHIIVTADDYFSFSDEGLI